MTDNQTTDTAAETEMSAYGSPLYKLRARLNGLFGALCGQGNELSDEMRAAMAYLDEHVTPMLAARDADVRALKENLVVERDGWKDIVSAVRSELTEPRAELGTAREMRPPTGMWQVSVRVPASLPRELHESLFEALAETAHGWEPQDRDGWDVDVFGHPTYQPCPDARAHKDVSGTPEAEHAGGER